MIMAAGVGTRLEPLTLAVPKPMVSVVNRPIMEYNVKLLIRHGFTALIANIHYHPEQVESYFWDGRQFGLGVSIKYSYEEKLLGTAGGVRKMADVGRVKDTFLVMSADVLTDVNLTRLWEFHKKIKALVTIGLVPAEDVSQFGVVVADSKTKRIGAFQEKPSAKEARSNLVNTGIYVCEPEILKMIPEDQPYDFGHELFPLLVKEQAPIFGCELDGYWSDVGSLDQYIRANYDLLNDRVKVPIVGGRRRDDAYIGDGTEIGKGVKLSTNVYIGEDCRIGDGVVIADDTVIGDNCVIEENARLSQAIVWSDAHIGARGRLKRCVIGNWCYLEPDVAVDEGAVVANRCRVKKGTRLGLETRLKPDGIV